MKCLFFGFKLVFLALFSLALSGCFFDNDSSDKDSSSFSDKEELIANETLYVESGDSVDIVALGGGKSYVWTQLSGVNAVIDNKTNATLSFIAPDVSEKTDLVFKINAEFKKPLHDQITISVFPVLIIDGVRLPPEPTPEENNATLAGIDVNGNGVRDDVERAIFTTYPVTISQQQLMQMARAGQQMLEDPDGIENAAKWQRVIANKFISCKYYLYRTFNVERDSSFIGFIENALYNNKDRVKRYLKYNHALGGGVYGGYAEVESDCDFNVPEALGLQP